MARLVLVHGAFGGAWCWEPLTALLEARDTDHAPYLSATEKLVDTLDRLAA
jgi:thioesterase domain-containing protein